MLLANCAWPWLQTSIFHDDARPDALKSRVGGADLALWWTDSSSLPVGQLGLQAIRRKWRPPAQDRTAPPQQIAQLVPATSVGQLFESRKQNFGDRTRSAFSLLAMARSDKPEARSRNIRRTASACSGSISRRVPRIFGRPY